MEIKAIPFTIIFLLLFSFLILLLYISQLSCNRISCINFNNINDYKLAKIFEENEFIFRSIYKKENNLLRLEIRKNSTQEEAKQAIQTQLVRTKGLFEIAAAPYPGEISDAIQCSDEYKPVYKDLEKNGLKISYFEGFVNDRLVFGSCVDDQAKYHNTLVMFYCEKQKNFHQLEIIIPREKYLSNPRTSEEILETISCR